MKAHPVDAARVIAEGLDAILEFDDVCDRGSDSGGWQSVELETAFKKVAAARAVLPAMSQQWLEYPENKPRIQYEELKVSHPLLFYTEEYETHIRLGYYRDGVFFESGDPLRYPHTAPAVKRFYEFPFPTAPKQEG